MGFQPGIIPLRPLTLGDLYPATMKAIRGNAKATIGLAFLTSLIFMVPTTALGTWIGFFSGRQLDAGDPLLALSAPFSTYLPTFGQIFATMLLVGFMSWVTGQAVMGLKVTPGQVWAATKGRIWALAGSTLLQLIGAVVLVVAMVAVGFGIYFGVESASPEGATAATVIFVVLALIAFVVLMVWLGVRLGFTSAVIVLENLGVFGAFGRSWRLTGGSAFWRLLGIRMLTGMVVGVVSSIITIPLTVASFFLAAQVGSPGQIFGWQTLMTGVSGLLAAALTTPFTAGVDSLLYIDQRIRREGLDVQIMRQLSAEPR